MSNAIESLDVACVDPADLMARAEPHAREIMVPPCPDILVDFVAQMRAPAPNLRRLSSLIGSDVALSAALLKTVNSSFYRLTAKASTVQQALAILGLRASANLISGLLLRQAFPVRANPLMQGFWTSTSMLAQCATGLATRLKCIPPDEAHTYMLFRDCGIAAMIARFADYGDIVELFRCKPSARAMAAELHRYRYQHARVGYAFTRNWMLPETLCLSILHHHDFEHLGDELPEYDTVNHKYIAFGLLADQVVALRAGGGLCPDWPSEESFVLETLQLQPEDVVALVQEEDTAGLHGS